jgi:hypothetical protein
MYVKSVKDQISLLAKLVEDANKKRAGAPDGDLGKCEWTDTEGNARCNSPWSQFQCEQAGGTFTAGGACDDEKTP